MIDIVGKFKIDDLALWNVVETPTYPTTTYAQIEYFYHEMSSGMYNIDTDTLNYWLVVADYYFGTGDYYQTMFWTYYDGWMLGLYIYLTDYDWTNGNGSESFGACIGSDCGGMWASAVYDTDYSETYYYFTPINFYYDGTPDASSPAVPYAYSD